MTLLCVPIFVEGIEQAKRNIASAIEAGADTIELRLDLVANYADVKVIRAGLSVPMILTCRSVAEGGEDERSDEERVAFLDKASAMGAPYVDVELQMYQRVPAIEVHVPRQLIVSVHDVKGRPARLYNLIDEMNKSRGSVNKIAWQARSIRDNIDAFELLQSRQKPTIALCMGEAGLMSRVLAKKFGAFLTFASLRPTEATAPGQPTIEEMKRLYRWDSITEKTKVFGVVGSPIAHSMSPAVHNAAFDDTGFDGVYLPMLVEPSYESFKAFMESFLAFPPLDLIGLSITIPHKENALRYLQSKGATIDPLAQKIGAINTIALTPSPRTRGEGWGEGSSKSQTTRLSQDPSPNLSPSTGRGAGGAGDLRGFNTDYDAILDSITDKLQISRDQLYDYRVAVIGAGGTARTAVAALSAHGATVVIYNRTREKADALANEFNSKSGRVVAARMEKLCDSCCHIFINATPIGMYPHVDASPLDGQTVHFSPDTLVFDAIYNPPETKLLRQAREQGAKTIGGDEMFIRQAGAQFRIWTGVDAPIHVMRDALHERLAQLAVPRSE